MNFEKTFNEAKEIKKGASVTFTNQEGDDVKAKVVSYDSKKKLYVISVKGNEVEAEPEELKESVNESYDYETYGKQIPKGLTDEGDITMAIRKALKKSGESTIKIQNMMNDTDFLADTISWYKNQK